MYVPEEKYEKINQLKKDGQYEKALDMVNDILSKDPNNEKALLQVADIKYVQGNISGAEKPVDFLMKYKDKSNPMSYYVKGVMAMEKTNWREAKDFLKKALKEMNENPEINRCYGLTEYWLGNKEQGLRILADTFKMAKYDAEIIYNNIELNILENNYEFAKEKIQFYEQNRDKIKYYDRDKDYYEHKLKLFKKYLNGNNNEDDI